MNYFQNTSTLTLALDRHAGRSDTASAQTVDIGIHLQDVLGTRDAAEFLQSNSINIDIALRALLQPAKRRVCEAPLDA